MFKPLKVVAVRIPTVAIPEILTLSRVAFPLFKNVTPVPKLIPVE